MRVRTLLKRAADLKKGAGKTPLSQKIDELVGGAALPKQVNAPTTLTAASEWLDNLAQAVESADGAPTPDNVRSFALLSSALDALEQRWRAISASAPR